MTNYQITNSSYFSNNEIGLKINCARLECDGATVVFYDEIDGIIMIAILNPGDIVIRLEP